MGFGVFECSAVVELRRRCSRFDGGAIIKGLVRWWFRMMWFRLESPASGNSIMAGLGSLDRFASILALYGISFSFIGLLVVLSLFSVCNMIRIDEEKL